MQLTLACWLALHHAITAWAAGVAARLTLWAAMQVPPEQMKQIAAEQAFVAYVKQRCACEPWCPLCGFVPPFSTCTALKIPMHIWCMCVCM